jgi:hypothetical protein
MVIHALGVTHGFTKIYVILPPKLVNGWSVHFVANGVRREEEGREGGEGRRRGKEEGWRRVGEGGGGRRKEEGGLESHGFIKIYVNIPLYISWLMG